MLHNLKRKTYKMHSFIFGEVSSRMVFDYKIYLNKRRVLIVCLFFFCLVMLY